MKPYLEGAARRPSSRLARYAHGPWTAVAMLLVMSPLAVMLTPGTAWAQNLTAPPSLKTIPVPAPNLTDPTVLDAAGKNVQNPNQFVKDKAAAIALGKTLFWDMQVGSDAVQACATCHFHAGADSRFVNSVNPGLNGVTPDATFLAIGPNGTLDSSMFPFTQFQSSDDRTSPMIRDWNDVVSSQGVYNTTFALPQIPGAVEQGIVVSDGVFNVGGLNTRRVEPRNTPTVINAVFNFANFWDGRANSYFNGSNPFGDADPNAGIWVASGKTLAKVRVRIPLSSLASQAVGPPGSPFEMSFAGRSFPDIGKKLLASTIVPLGKQNVDPTDSVLGGLAKSKLDKRGRPVFAPGLNTTYAAMVKAAFLDKFWNAKATVSLPHGNFTQMEANFSLFFGLAVQLYEATLVSDDSPYDRAMNCRAGITPCDPGAMSASAQEGLNIFLTDNELGGVGGNCINCHGTSTFSNASVMHVGAANFGDLPEGIIERMIMGDSGGAWYDAGYYDISVRPIEEDLGRGGKDPFGNPLSFIERSLMVFNGQTSQLSYDPFATQPAGVVALPCGPTDPFFRVCPDDQRVATKGSFKVPTLRNVELTGPYMHNGGEATLMQVLDFYGRGGNFSERNIATFDPDIQPLFGLNPSLTPGGAAAAEANQRKVIDFLMSLTDERVRFEKAPFDHPQLFIPDGGTLVPCGTAGQVCDSFLALPAVGANGLSAVGQPPIGTFLGLPPYPPQ